MNKKTENNRQDTNIIFLKKEMIEGKKHYVLTLQHIKDKEGKDIWFELDDRWNEAIQILGRLNDLMDKYGITNLDLLDSILSIFKENICIRQYGDKTRNHWLKHFNKDYAFVLKTKYGEPQISATDFQRLKMFLPKENVGFID